jgi:hypothetical protein
MARQALEKRFPEAIFKYKVIHETKIQSPSGFC